MVKNIEKGKGKGVRPIFIPNKQNVGVMEKNINFDWHMGMSLQVKKRSIDSLHEEAKKQGFSNILEASSKSEQEIGIQLSAFFLEDDNGYPVENLFQSSKVFEDGGPYLDLLTVTPREAKKSDRLKNSGGLKKFVFKEKDYPLEPKSLFYDWLYLNVLFLEKNEKIRNLLLNGKFDAFSDIEFNPKKSFSCQARTLALCVSLYENNAVEKFIYDPIKFSQEFELYTRADMGDSSKKQQDLF